MGKLTNDVMAHAKYPGLNLGTGQVNTPPAQKDPHGIAGPSTARESSGLNLNLVTGQPIQPAQPSVLDKLLSAATESLKAMGVNLADATPFTPTGWAKGLAAVGAEARGGLLDLQKIVVHAFPDSAQQEAVLGMPGLPTPGMVDQERGRGGR